MPPQMWAFLGSIAAGAATLPFAVLGELRWAAGCLGVAIGAGVAARVWSHRSPAPMPHWIRWVLVLPRTSQSADRLKAILQPQPGERLLEIGPGVGIHALPVGAALAPGGTLHVVDVQWEMLEDLRRRAAQAALNNLREVVGDAQRLPYPDRSFDAAYLISVLGEVPDEQAALRELHRVLKPGGTARGRRDRRRPRFHRRAGIEGADGGRGIRVRRSARPWHRIPSVVSDGERQLNRRATGHMGRRSPR